MKCTFLNKEIKYHGRCTICTLECKISFPMKRLPKPIDDWVCFHPQLEDMMFGFGNLTFKVSGKSIRNLEDANDNTIGVRLAESRAKKKAYKFCETLLWKIAKDYAEKATECTKASGTFEHYHDKEVSHYNELMVMA